jgi:PAP2 superfamily
VGIRQVFEKISSARKSILTDITFTNSPRPGAAHAAALRAGFVSNRLLYGFAGFVFLSALLEALLLDLPLDFGMVLIFSGPVLIVLLLMVLLGLGLETIRLARARYEGALLPALWSKLRDDYLAPRRVSNAFHAVIFMTLYMVGYTFIKKAIPTAHPFAWDQTFMQWDNALHFGTHPYQWLAPLLNVQWVTSLLNWNYNIWFFVMFTLWFWQGFSATDRKLRQHFLLGFTLTWFVGTCGLGTIFSSVGPCFYGRLLPGEVDPYAPLMAWLTHVNQTHSVFALNVMDELWKNYESGQGLVNGISAMPSMHVGTSILFAILGFASGHRWLGWLLTFFASLIVIGSVHLGWHYAIDGYLGAAVAAFGWWFSGKLVDWDRKARGVI